MRLRKHELPHLRTRMNCPADWPMGVEWKSDELQSKPGVGPEVRTVAL